MEKPVFTEYILDVYAPFVLLNFQSVAVSVAVTKLPPTFTL